MDGVLSALSGALPQLGLGGLLAFVIGLLVKLLMDERSRHTTELDAIAKRHGEELQAKAGRLAAAHQRIEDLEATVDLEREARRRAEDEAARLRHELQSRGWSA